MDIMLAIILGLMFGFVLQKIGSAEPQRIIDMLRLKDLHLMKAIALGIGISSFALFGLISLGLVDAGNLSVKASYVGVIVGGAMLGIGWAVAGFCPGTSVVALGVGRKDALFFIVGGLVGAFMFTLLYGSLKTTFLFDDLAGKAALVATENEKFTAILPSIPAIGIAGSIAILFMAIAWVLPSKNN